MYYENGGLMKIRIEKLNTRLKQHEVRAVSYGQLMGQILGSVIEIDDMLQDKLLDEADVQWNKTRRAELQKEYQDLDVKRNETLGRMRIIEEMLAVESEKL